MYMHTCIITFVATSYIHWTLQLNVWWLKTNTCTPYPENLHPPYETPSHWHVYIHLQCLISAEETRPSDGGQSVPKILWLSILILNSGPQWISLYTHCIGEQWHEMQRGNIHRPSYLNIYSGCFVPPSAGKTITIAMNLNALELFEWWGL